MRFQLLPITCLLAWTACSAPAPKSPVTITRRPWGALPDGTPVHLFTFRTPDGMELDISDYGGIITRWTAPDRAGRYADIVLGHETLEGYLQASPYFGAIVGRYGNRIGQARFDLDGKTYQLTANNFGNQLHGGVKGFDQVVWQAEVLEDSGMLRLRYRSADGEEGYPGNLDAAVTCRLSGHALEIRYEAVTDAPTVVNLTNHSYFNLGGGPDILGHRIQLNASRFVVVDSLLIPTGELRAVEGGPFDFRTEAPIGARIGDTADVQIRLGRGYDHCWVFDAGIPGSSRPAATAYDPGSGRELQVFTSEPGVQFYTGNFLDGSITGKGGQVYGHRSGFCLETQHFPDSPNQPSFPSTVLRPGETYRSSTRFVLSVRPE